MRRTRNIRAHARRVFVAIALGIAWVSPALAASDIASSFPVNLGVSGVTNVLYAVAFIGGALMILSPCSAATIPAYFAASFAGPEKKASKKEITKRTLSFFVGFAIVYSFIGAGASFIGRVLNIYQEPLAATAGALLVIFGVLVFSGKGFRFLRKSPQGKANQTHRGNVLFGMLFAVGFSGCAGPILAAILTIAVNLPTSQAILLMLFYSLGMGVPLVLLSLFFDRIQIFNTRFFRWRKAVSFKGNKITLTAPNIISGTLLVVVGVVFMVYRSTFVLSASFPRFLTEAGYAVQDKLLKMNLPPYIDTLLFIILAFVGIKALDRWGDVIWMRVSQAPKLLKGAKTVLVATVVVQFAINQFLFFTIQADAKKQKEIAAERARPAEFSVTTLVAPDCEECVSLAPLIESFRSGNVRILSEKQIDYKSVEGRKLVEQYQVQRIPVVIIQGEVDKDPSLRSVMEQRGKIEGDTFVFTDTPPPFVDVENGEVRGNFSVIYLDDPSCDSCYDPTDHAPILKRLGMSPQSEETISSRSSQGKNLIRKYKIEKIPTIVLQGDLEVYNRFNTIWKQVGTVEEDGTLVFRNVDIMGTYRNTETGEIVVSEDPEPSEPPSSPTNDGSAQEESDLSITTDEFSFSSQNIEVKKGEPVSIRISNIGNAPHNFVSRELGVSSSVLSPGESEVITFTPEISGSFAFYCSLPGHREAGMEGKIEVLESGA